jgi:hypothetical protein
MLKIISGFRSRTLPDRLSGQWIRKEPKSMPDVIALFAAVLAVAFFLVCAALQHGISPMTGDDNLPPLSKFNSPYFGR